MTMTSDPSSKRDRRSGKRILVNSQFKLLYGHIDSFATSLSQTGAFIRTADLRPVGAEVALRLTITDMGIDRIEGVGRVARVSHDPQGMGIEFLTLTPESRALIDRLLDRGDDFLAPPIPPIQFENPQDL